MSVLNRKIGPAVTNEFDLRIANVKSALMENGISLYELNTGTQEILKVELVFKAGRIHENRPAVSKAAIKLLREGPESLSSEQTAYVFDYYGAVFKAESSMEYSSVSLVCLTSHFEKLWPVWLEAVLSPAYRQEELDKYKEIRSKGMRNQLSKNEVVAYREFTEKLFGSHHPYGYNTEPEDILTLRREDLQSYFQKNCRLSNAFVVLSGHYGPSVRDKIMNTLGRTPTGQKPLSVEFPVPDVQKGTFRVQTSNALQTSVKMGCLWVPRRHEDYVALRFLNTVLGGYFGSRLMKNIREDKGYTYGIYSAFDTWQKAGYFYISTDMGSEYLELGMKEVHKEIQKLKDKPLGSDEMKMVKNYLLGQSLNLIDGPFATAQLIKSLRAKDLDLGIFESAVREIRDLSSKRIQALANQYLDEKEFTTVLVGQN